ncbi:MAG: hypothetical protein ACE5IQ_08540 [Candidatus Methylomirabilales bacterium]
MTRITPGHGSDASVPDLLQPVLEDYAQAVRTPIHAHAPASRLSPPRRDGGLHLHVFALPAQPHWSTFWPVTPSVEIPAVFCWGLAAGTKKALDPGNLFSHGALTFDQRGRAITGTLGENIYVLFDLLGQPEPLVPVILRRILDLCLGGLSESLSLQSGRLPHQVHLTLDRLKHTTMLITLNERAARGEHPGIQDHVSDNAGPAEDGECIRKRMTVAEENLRELSRQMASQTRLLMHCRERYRTLTKADESEEALTREFDRLLAIPEVRDVQVLGDRLCVLTETVDTVVAGRRYRLGRFRLDIRFNGDVAITNLTRAYGYYDHPHIWNTKPCLGNIGQSVVKLVSEFQWVAAAELLLEYLKTVSPKEWYTPIDHWEERSP